MRVQDGRQEELTALLKENFAKQQSGTFLAEELAESGREILALITPEYREEFRQAQAHFRENI